MLAELAAANAAFSVIKTAVQNGKELTQVGKAISDFTFSKDHIAKTATKKKNSIEINLQNLDKKYEKILEIDEIIQFIKKSNKYSSKKLLKTIWISL